MHVIIVTLYRSVFRVSASANSCFNWRVCTFSLLSDDSNSSFSALRVAIRCSLVLLPLAFCKRVNKITLKLSIVAKKNEKSEMQSNTRSIKFIGHW